MKPQLFSAGNPTVVVAAKDRAAVDRAWLDFAGLKTLKYVENESFCVFLFAPTSSLFSDVCAGIRRSRGSGDRKLNRTFGSFHDAPPPYLESWGHLTKLESRSWFNSFR